MVQAYVFINISARDPLEVLTALRQIPEVQEAHILLGPIDGIAKLECPTQEKLQEVLVAIRWIPGVAKTDTRYVYA